MPTKRVKGKKKLKSIKAKQTDAMGSKRRLAKFGKEQRKGMRGCAANYITRSQALKRLQITLKDFRRLCILKGIYPREPKKKTGGKEKTYYYLKDVMFVAHEPVLEKFRAFKTFMKKIKKAMGRKDYQEAKRKHENRPLYELDHLVKERYPRFIDALGDLDDALCLVHLFALMPTGNGIHAEATSMCLRLVREWQNYIVVTRSLTKVFVSIKGIYYQAHVQGQTMTWLVPHQFTPTVDKRVDVRVMLTFLEFYQVLLKFVNAQLYMQIGVAYPPKINLHLDSAGALLAAIELERTKEETMNDTDAKMDEVMETDKDISEQQKESEKRLKTLGGAIAKYTDPVEEDEHDEDETLYGKMSEPLEAAFASNELAAQIYSEQRKERSEKSLFSGLTFFLSREVPSACLELVLRSHGATLGWDGAGSPLDEKNTCITHHIMDRPHQGHRYFNREYVQPQWVFDSVNNGILLPLARYVPGADLPPHLSPFVDDAQEGYTPEYRKELEKLKSASQVLREVGAVGVEGASDSEDEDAEEMEEAYAAGLKAEVDGRTVEKEGSDSEEEEAEEEDGKKEDEVDDDDDETVEEEEDKSLSLKRKADVVTAIKKSKRVKKEEDAAELKELAKTMMSKKAKRLYDRMQYGLGKKADKIQKLEDKRAKLEAEKEKSKVAETSTKVGSKKHKRKHKGVSAK
ncbi:unnamed protein product [Peronospora belbahrii]|uniref:Pescadillo homolog n=1 Tax=Peronospora belbahrii TaxID=622444 RepID=A0AAU9L7A0_9STRA|nr:unnamed protein product [Peronospora belbahrii]CAH0521924.1 unnamed protein product [Peronospora belbahrii]